MKWILFSAFLLIAPAAIAAESVYQSPENFLSSAFNITPESKRLTLSGDLGREVKAILGHRYKKIRVPYWQEECRSAWILEEIGKERYITTGFIVWQICQKQVVKNHKSKYW